MRRAKYLIVLGLEKVCVLLHPVMHHYPWLLLGKGKHGIRNVWCLPSCASLWLDGRWHTGVWETPPPPQPIDITWTTNTAANTNTTVWTNR